MYFFISQTPCGLQKDAMIDQNNHLSVVNLHQYMYGNLIIIIIIIRGITPPQFTIPTLRINVSAANNEFIDSNVQNLAKNDGITNNWYYAHLPIMS